jgi:hypothetical protein
MAAFSIAGVTGGQQSSKDGGSMSNSPVRSHTDANRQHLDATLSITTIDGRKSGDGG